MEPPHNIVERYDLDTDKQALEVDAARALSDAILTARTRLEGAVTREFDAAQLLPQLVSSLVPLEPNKLLVSTQRGNARKLCISIRSFSELVIMAFPVDTTGGQEETYRARGDHWMWFVRQATVWVS